MRKIIYTLAFVLIFHCIFNLNNCKGQWIQCNGIPGGYISALAASGNNMFAGEQALGVFLSTNNGTNWTQTSLNNQSVLSINISGNNIFAGTFGYGVYRSTNNGSNWTQTALIDESINSIIISGNYIFAGTDDGVFISTNNGSNWTRTLNNQAVYCLTNSGNNLFAGTAGNGVYLSMNNGGTWAQTALTNNNVFSLAASGNIILAGTSGNGIYLSSNNGSNWTAVNYGLTNQYILSLAISGANLIAGTAGGVFLSTNNGTNWLNKNQGFSVIPGIPSLLVANNYIFAGTDGNSIWRRSLTDILSVINTSLETPTSYSLYQNYPNPFNPVTKIKFDIPSDVKRETQNGYFPLRRGVGGMTTLKIYDILGKEIATLVNEQLQPGTYEVIFDGSTLPSGVYFYQLRAGEFVQTKKLILLK